MRIAAGMVLTLALLACEDESLVIAMGGGESVVGVDLDAALSPMRDAAADGGELVCYTTHEALWPTVVGDAGYHATSCAKDEDCVPAPSSFACSNRQAVVSGCPWPIAAAHLDAAQSALRALSVELCPRVPVRCLNTAVCPRFTTRCLDRQCRAVLFDGGR